MITENPSTTLLWMLKVALESDGPGSVYCILNDPHVLFERRDVDVHESGLITLSTALLTGDSPVWTTLFSAAKLKFMKNVDVALEIFESCPYLDQSALRRLKVALMIANEAKN